MRRTLTFLAFFLLPVAVSASTSGDVKIRTRQTTGGATFESTTYIKGDRTRTESANGLTVSISQCSAGRDITLNTAARTYTINERTPAASSGQITRGAGAPSGEVSLGGTVTITTTLRDTGERKQIFGYTARRIQSKVVFESSADACTVMNNRFETDGWYIDADFAPECSGTAGAFRSPEAASAGGCRDQYKMKTIGTAKKGFAIFESTTIYMEGSPQPMTMTNEVVEISRAEVDPALFEIPEGYALASDESPPAGVTIPGAVSRNTGPSLAVSAPVGEAPSAPAAKKEGVIRIGIANVKVAASGDAMPAQDLSAAVRASFAEYLKTPEIEVVLLESKLPSAAMSEAAGLACDAVLFVTASHKKGGGGFGSVFGKVIAPAVGSVGIGQTGSVAGNIAGQTATYAIINAGSMASNVKAKDEITLAVEVSGPAGARLLSKEYKRKARSNGEDIITPLIEEAATAIVSLRLGSSAR